jgi:hypothetical protein
MHLGLVSPEVAQLVDDHLLAVPPKDQPKKGQNKKALSTKSQNIKARHLKG